MAIAIANSSSLRRMVSRGGLIPRPSLALPDVDGDGIGGGTAGEAAAVVRLEPDRIAAGYREAVQHLGTRGTGPVAEAP